MILDLRSGLLSALVGFLVGFAWEGFGAAYLWVLSDPRLLIFGLAMIAWAILGLIMATILRITEVNAPRYKVFAKPLTGPLALVVAMITSKAGLISYPSVKLSLFGVPWYMMIGWLVLAYLLDLIIIRRMPLQQRL